MRYILLPVILSILIFSLLNCSKTSTDPKLKDTTMVKKDTFFIMNYDVNALTISNAFDSGRIQGTIQDLALDEISGIAASYAVPNALWSEEDSGNENKIYLLDITTGKSLVSLRLPIDNRDWEDIDIGAGPVDGVHYIYLAEIGDNKHSTITKYIYRFTEPLPIEITSGITDYKLTVDKIAFQYPDGKKNAEAIMIDPLTKDIYIISKEGQAVVYVARYPQSTSTPITVIKLGVLPISTVTAASISPDGSEIILKNYDRIFYWKKTGSESITQLLQKKPARLVYVPEPKGESICWKPDASGYYTTSEMTDSQAPKIYFYKRK